MEVNKEKIPCILQFFFDKGKTANQVAEIVNGVYGADTLTAHYVQFWFRLFRSGIFYVKIAPRTGKPVIENADKITEIIEVDRYDQTLNSDLYCQQLNCLKLATDQKRSELANRRGFVFHQDNATPHTSVVTRQKLWELN
ncbi:histone-lysine N-methyltransferase SETMAR [Trichonephila clavipes]|nr:histone-lysine N-methyltransferase SETMAR [Trichonephila clavipes]